MQTVLIYTEAGTFGLGHIKRQIVLARELQQRGLSVEFVHPWHEHVGWDILHQSGFRVSPSEVELPSADMLIVDVEEYPSRDLFLDWRTRYSKVVLFGGAAYPRFDGENLVDLTVYQGELFDGPSSGHALNGLEYVIVDPAFAACWPSASGHIVVSMGGRDLYNMTPIALAALEGIDRRVICIIGPQFDNLSFKWAQAEIVQSPASLAPYLDGAALCVCATGMTAYEALAAGVLVVLGNISEDHERTAQELDRLGVAVNLGQTHEFTAERCAHSIDYFINGRIDVWPEISKRACSLIDGHGVERVSEKVCQLIIPARS